MNINKTPIEGVYEVDLTEISDERGSFSRLFCSQTLKGIIGKKQIVQINQSNNNLAGTVRGMHYQIDPAAEMKLIKCVVGSIFDVVVDLRKNSDTFLKYHAVNLSESNNKMIVIPEGCAHGFQALQNNSSLIYFHTNFYNQKCERGIRYDEPLVGVNWPLTAINLSSRDKNFESIKSNNFIGI